MSETVLFVAIVVLLISSLFTMLMVFHILGILRATEQHVGLSPGQTLPRLTTHKQPDDLLERNLAAQLPLALLFLSKNCPACLQALDDVKSALVSSAGAGVKMLVVRGASGSEEHDELLDGLSDFVVEVDQADIVRLNPHRAAPSYLFVDKRTVQASGYVGDENWISFRRQLAGK